MIDFHFFWLLGYTFTFETGVFNVDTSASHLNIGSAFGPRSVNVQQQPAPQTPVSISNFTVHIDGQITTLGETIFEQGGLHFVEAFALESDPFGLAGVTAIDDDSDKGFILPDESWSEYMALLWGATGETSVPVVVVRLPDDQFFVPLEMASLFLGYSFAVADGIITISTTEQTNQITTPIVIAEQPSSWAVEQVNNAISAELVPQNLQSQFTQPTTRAEFAALAVALYENVTGRTITERMEFNDTSDINVQKMGGLGVVTGVGGGNFNPSGELTREQAAVMLSRLANAIGSPLPQVAPTFADNAQISAWAVDAVGQIQAAGIMGGTGNNMFSPSGDYTREQSIVTLLRLFEIVN